MQKLWVFLTLRCGRVDFERAEPLGKGNVLGRCQVLVAEKNHFVLEQSGANFSDLRIIQRFAKIKAEDFRPNHRAQGPQFEAAEGFWLRLNIHLLFPHRAIPVFAALGGQAEVY
jgi:hypothetical protein